MNKSLLIFSILFCLNSLIANKTTELLLDRMVACDTLVCVGLDPDPTKFPEEILSIPGREEDRALAFLKEVVCLTHEDVCCYKLQKAFFDVFEQGHALLKDTVRFIRSVDPTIPVIIDCKIGDTENTMQAYAFLLFDTYQADAILVNPYMGDAVFDIFQNKDYTGVVLIQTSNPSAKVVQELRLENGQFLWEKMLSLMCGRWNANNNLIPVISSNSGGYDYSQLRASIPDDMPILLAGIGAQGGDLTVLDCLLNSQRSAVFVSSSRGLIYPYVQSNPLWRDRIVCETVKLKNKINTIRWKDED